MIVLACQQKSRHSYDNKYRIQLIVSETDFPKKDLMKSEW